MPLSIIDYSKIAPQKPAIGDFLGNILKGYQMEREPTRIRQAEEAAKYNNMIKQVQAQFARPKSEAELQGMQLGNENKSITNKELGDRLHAMLIGQNLQNQTREMTNQGLPERLQAQLGLTQAQTEKAMRGPAPVMSNYEKLLSAIPRIEQQYGPDSQEAKDARAMAHNLSITKSSQSGGMIDENTMSLTTPVKSLNQSIIGAVNNAVPLLDKLSTFDTPTTGLGDPNKAAVYQSMTNQLTDQLMTALKLPQTNESIDMVKSMVTRHWFESDKGFHDRIKELKKDLTSRKLNAQKTLKGGISLNEAAEETGSDPLGLF